jgi:hypothetical protein
MPDDLKLEPQVYEPEQGGGAAKGGCGTMSETVTVTGSTGL